MRIRRETAFHIPQSGEDRAFVSRECRDDAGLGQVELRKSPPAVEDRPASRWAGSVKAGAGVLAEQLIGLAALHTRGSSKDQMREQLGGGDALLRRCRR